MMKCFMRALMLVIIKNPGNNGVLYRLCKHICLIFY